MRYKFIVCSDIHSAQLPDNNPVYKKYETSGFPAFCCGDFCVSTSGIWSQPDSTATTYYRARQMLKKFVNLDGLVIAGNHDSGSNYGGRGIEGFNELTLYEGYEGNPYVNVKTILGDVFIGVSDSIGDCGYTQETQDLVLDLIDNVYAGRRIILMTHYAFCLGSSFENAFACRAGLDQNGIYRTGLTYPSSTAAAATRAGFFTQIATNHPNVLWFSGHCHNDWRLQSENVTVTDKEGVEHTDGMMPNIKVYKYPGGAMMINLPSVRWRGQDAICEVYDDKIVVKAREADASVRSLIVADSPAATVGTEWDFNELGGVYSYNFEVGGEPIETRYTATFVADGETVDTVEFEAGATILPRVPNVPTKEGYTGEWEPYTLADADITINAVYTPVQPDAIAYDINGDEIYNAYDINGASIAKLYDINGESLV